MSTSRKDPLMNFRFVVEIDGVQSAGFVRVKGVSREIKLETYREGGLNDYEHKLASNTVYGPITLERGLVDKDLWSWQDDAVEGRVRRRDLTITMRDVSGEPRWRWLVSGAIPTKWSASDLDGASAQTLVESVELAHHGIKRG